MTKLQLLVRSDRALDGRELGARLLELAPARLKLTVSIPAPRLSVIPFQRSSLALASIWPVEDEPPDRWARAIDAALPGARVEGYRVDESTPRAYARDWPDGEETPGVVLLTLFCKPRSLGWDAFIRAWHGHHTPLSLEIHPLWCYIRNVVEEAIPGARPLDAIVEEHFRERRDLLNPLRFFGGPLSMIPNMARVALDVRRFIELSTMEVYLARELWLRS